MGETLGAGGGASGASDRVSAEELLRRLVWEHGETSFVARYSALGERVGEWIDPGDGAEHAQGEGSVCDVETQQRSFCPPPSLPPSLLPCAMLAHSLAGSL